MIIITGAAGFLGSELARQLAMKGEDLCCLKRDFNDVPAFLIPFGDRITWFDVDMVDYAVLETTFKGATQVYHCAALVSFREQHRAAMISNNVQVTINVVALCKQMGARLLHVSSVAAIGLAEQGELITEDLQLDLNKPQDGYAISKFKSEAEVWKGIADGLDAVVVNPSVMIGKSVGKKGSGEIFETMRKGMPFYTLGSVGFVDVEDVARCMILLMHSAVSAQRFILNADNVDYKNFGARVSHAFNKPAPKIPILPWVLELAWRGASIWSFITGKGPAIDKATAKNISRHYRYDNSKIRRTIGFDFKPLSQTITEICENLKP